MRQDDGAEFISASLTAQKAAAEDNSSCDSLFRSTQQCYVCSTQTPRYASNRVLICLNTCGLLKRATLERKKSAGGRTPKRSTSSNHTSLTLVFLGRFPIRPVSQSALSYGLASWTGQHLLTGFTRVCFGAPHSKLFVLRLTALLLSSAALPCPSSPTADRHPCGQSVRTPLSGDRWGGAGRAS